MKRAAAKAEERAWEAKEIIERVAAGLSPERATAYLAAAPVVEALELSPLNAQPDGTRRNPPRCSGWTLSETPDPAAASRMVSSASSLGSP